MVLMEVGSVRAQLEQFGECVFEPTDTVELRFLKQGTGGKKPAKCEFTTGQGLAGQAEHLLRMNGDGWNVYAGANPRKTVGGTEAEDVLLARNLFVDFDHCTVEDVRANLARCNLPRPTLITFSGHGVHAWYRLTEDLTTEEELAEWRALQKRFIQLVKSDESIHDLPRIMRLPGFINHKGQPTTSAVIEANPSLRYSRSTLEALLPQLPAARPLPQYTPSQGGQGTRWAQVALEREATRAATAPEGKRNIVLASAATKVGQLVGSGLLEESYATSELSRAALASGQEEGEIADTLHRQIEFGKQHPRWPVDNRPQQPVRLPPPMPHAPLVQQNVLVIKQPSQDDELMECFSDLTNARRLVKRSGNDFKYVAPWRKFIVYDGKRWIMDIDGGVMRFAKTSADQELIDAEQEPDEPLKKQRMKHAQASQSAHSLEASIKLAGTEPGIPINLEQLNASPYLFNCKTGTIDLSTGNIRPHAREDLLTKLCNTKYDRDAKCPRWELFLDEAMGGNRQLIEYLQRAVGYSLTGSVIEQVLFFLHGSGANGKSVFLAALQYVLGTDYAMQGVSDLLMAKMGDRHPTELADLFGMRFVSLNETEQDRELAESLVKQLTGGDRIRARRMKEDFWEFSPTHKLWLAGNHKPRIKGQDKGIWRRIHLIPWLVTVTPDKQDKDLSTKLMAEAEGILAWVVRGCDAWRTEGLNPPHEVLEAVKAYQNEQDDLGAFIDERCVVGDTYSVPSSKLLEEYASFISPAKPPTKNSFADMMTGKGFSKEKSKATSLMMWQRITIRP